MTSGVSYAQRQYGGRIELYGPLCLIYVDGYLVIDTPETNPLVGGIGLQTASYHKLPKLLEPEQWQMAWFDEVTVEAL